MVAGTAGRRLAALRRKQRRGAARDGHPLRAPRWSPSASWPPRCSTPAAPPSRRRRRRRSAREPPSAGPWPCVGVATACRPGWSSLRRGGGPDPGGGRHQALLHARLVGRRGARVAATFASRRCPSQPFSCTMALVPHVAGRPLAAVFWECQACEEFKEPGAFYGSSDSGKYRQQCKACDGLWKQLHTQIKKQGCRALYYEHVKGNRSLRMTLFTDFQTCVKLSGGSPASFCIRIWARFVARQRGRRQQVAGLWRPGWGMGCPGAGLWRPGGRRGRRRAWQRQTPSFWSQRRLGYQG